MNRLNPLLALAACLLSAVHALPASDFEREVFLRWNTETLNAIRNSRTAPPMAAYKLAAIHVGMYDAINNFNPTHEHFFFDEPPPEGANRAAAFSTVAYRILTDLWGKYVNPRRFQRVQDEVIDLITEEMGEAGIEAGIEYGERIAATCVHHCTTSGKDKDKDWPGITEIGVWRETPPFFRPALLPNWPYVRPYTLERVDQFRAPPPPALDSEQYTREFNEVKRIGARDKPDRSHYDTLSSVFWSDDLGSSTPAGSWNLIAQDVTRSQELSLEEAARCFALMNLTAADAGIICWDSKYHYNFWRPENAIREADADGNPDTEPDPDWIPLMASPPFPEYPSGHSTFSRGSAHALTLFFGRDDIPFQTTSDQVPGAVREYSGFDECANEVGMSRLHGGIHFQAANVQGQNQGIALAEYVHDHFLRPLDGE